MNWLLPEYIADALPAEAERIELYQASRCMFAPLPAIGATDRLCRELA